MPRDRVKHAPRHFAYAPARGDTRAMQDRTRIAQAAARLIAEHGITDWSAAKRKAARQLDLPEGVSLPSNEDLEQALTDHHALFGGEAHVASLRAQRTAALRWMRRLERWMPLLVGGVAAGWASEHSDIHLELVADDPKTVEIELAGEGVRYAGSPPRSEDGSVAASAQLLIEGTRMGLRVSIVSPLQRRNRPRRDDGIRLSTPELVDLLGQP